MDGIGMCICGDPDCFVSVVRRTVRGVDIIGECGIEDTIVSSTYLESARDAFLREFFEREENK